jgi:hypothetical protein
LYRETPTGELVLSVTQIFQDKMDKLFEKALTDLMGGRGTELRMITGLGTRSVILIPSPLFAEPQPLRLLIAFEGYGAMLYDGKRPLNKFMLAQYGFPLESANLISDLVQELFNAAPRKNKTPALEGSH